MVMKLIRKLNTLGFVAVIGSFYAVVIFIMLLFTKSRDISSTSEENNQDSTYTNVKLR